MLVAIRDLGCTGHCLHQYQNLPAFNGIIAKIPTKTIDFFILIKYILPNS